MDWVACFDAAWCERLVWTLVHFVWQGAVVGVIAMAVGVALRAAPATVRYGWYVAALLVMASCPAATWTMLGPAAGAGVQAVAAAMPMVESSSSEPMRDPSPAMGDGASVAAAAKGDVGLDARASVAPKIEAAPANPPSAVRPDSPFGVAAWRRYAPCAAACYALGVLAMLVRLTLGLGGGQRLRRHSQPVDDAAVLVALGRQAKRIGLKVAPAIATCSRVAVPTVVGVIRPMILLPLSLASNLTVEQIEVLLAHELAHIRRHDYLVNVVQRLIEAALFFHPAVWIVSRRIRIEREHCCDDRVLAVGGQLSVYAESLVRVAELGCANGGMSRLAPTAALGAAGRPSQLRSRIMRLLDVPEHAGMRLRRSWVLVVGASIVLALVLVVQSGAQIKPAGDSDASTSSTSVNLHFKRLPAEQADYFCIQGLGRPTDPAAPLTFCKSDRPLHWHQPKGAMQSAMVIDESGGTGTGYDRLYVDFDGDGDFTDDPVYTKSSYTGAGPDSGAVIGHFDNVHVVSRRKQNRMAHVQVYLSATGPSEHPATQFQCAMTPQSWAVGHVEIDGQRVPAALIDRNWNDSYVDAQGFGPSDANRQLPRGDYLVLGIDGEATLIPGGRGWFVPGYGGSARTVLTSYLVLDTGTYEVVATQSEPGVRLEFKPASPPTGKAKLLASRPGQRAMVIGSRAAVVLTTPVDLIDLPADTYGPPRERGPGSTVDPASKQPAMIMPDFIKPPSPDRIAATHTSEPPTMVIAHITNREGDPVAGTSVMIRTEREDIGTRRVLTDDQGQAKLGRWGPGEMTLVVTANGYGPERVELSVSQDQSQGSETHFTAALQPGHVITGRVVDTQGDPIPDVLLSNATWRGQHLGTSLRTDDDGRFHWDGAPSDPVQFGFFKRGYIDQNRVQLSPDTPDHTVTMSARVTFTGSVTDAKTGEPIRAFTVVPGDERKTGERPSWQEGRGQAFTDGQYEFQPYDARTRVAIRIDAEGYAPATSHLVAADAGPQVFDAALESIEQASLTVRRPDGSPVAQADVYVLNEGSRYLSLNNGQIQRPTEPSKQTDARGQVFVAQTHDIAAVFIAHEDGCARLSKGQLATVKDVTLQPWARVQGQVAITGADNAKRDIYLWRMENGIGDPISHQIFARHDAVTDSDGQFVIERIWPGPGRIGVRGASVSSHRGAPIDLVAGQTTHVTLGGSGRQVIGRLVPPEGVDEAFDPIQSHVSLIGETGLPPLAPPDRPAQWSSMDNSERVAWIAQWRQSESDQAYQKAALQHHSRTRRHMFGATLSADGAFEIPDVPAGTYTLSARLSAPLDPEARVPPKIIAMATRTLTIDKGTGSIDLGTITATPAPAAGVMAPDFDLTTLDGEPLRLADHRGKFVLLQFWETRSGRSTRETPHLKAVYDAFGDDERFVMISLSLDREPLAPIEYAAKQDIRWLQGFLGEWIHSRVFAQYGVRSISVIFLIGPDGKILANDLRGPTIKEAVAKVLGPPPTTQPAADAPKGEIRKAVNLDTRANQPGASNMNEGLQFAGSPTFVPGGEPGRVFQAMRRYHGAMAMRSQYLQVDFSETFSREDWPDTTAFTSKWLLARTGVGRLWRWQMVSPSDEPVLVGERLIVDDAEVYVNFPPAPKEASLDRGGETTLDRAWSLAPLRVGELLRRCELTGLELTAEGLVVYLFAADWIANADRYFEATFEPSVPFHLRKLTVGSHTNRANIVCAYTDYREAAGRVWYPRRVTMDLGIGERRARLEYTTQSITMPQSVTGEQWQLTVPAGQLTDGNASETLYLSQPWTIGTSLLGQYGRTPLVIGAAEPAELPPAPNVP